MFRGYSHVQSAAPAVGRSNPWPKARTAFAALTGVFCAVLALGFGRIDRGPSAHAATVSSPPPARAPRPSATDARHSPDAVESAKLAQPDEVIEALPATIRANTPMGEEEAAERLATAWHAVARERPTRQNVAILWAQWAHETGRGQRMHGYNFAGLKGRGPDGASIVIWTREGPDTKDLVQRTFRAYDSPAEGASDYVRLLAERYPSALRAARDGNVARFVNALETRGYFTGDDRAYRRALGSLTLECLRRGIAARALERLATKAR